MKKQTINDTYPTIDLAYRNGEKDNFFSKENQYICISEYNESLWRELLENGFTQMKHSELLRLSKEQNPAKEENLVDKTNPIKVNYHKFWHSGGYMDTEFPDREGQND